jgi:hypothetical protein
MLLTALKTIQGRKGSDTAASAIAGMFSAVKNNPQLVHGLAWFLATEVKDITDFATNASEAKRLKKSLRTARETLDLLSSSVVAE